MATCYNCPYFKLRTRRQISCEGAIIRLPDRQGLSDFAQAFCASAEGYKKCTFYKLLGEYYDRKYDTE